LRSLAIHHDLALITSSRQELVDLCHSDEVRTSPFFNIFANINLRGLTPDEAEEMIAHSLSGTDLTFTDQDRQAIAQISGYHPFFTQVAAHFMWDAHREGIPEDQRPAYVRSHFDAESDPHFSDYCQHSTENERIVLTALALHGVLNRRGETSCSVDEIRQAFGRLDLIAGQLEKRSLVMRQDQGLSLFSPAFEDWVVGEVFDLSGTADHDFQSWLVGQNVAFKAEVREILPHIMAKHRLWVGKWLSDDDASCFLQIVRRFIGGG
jgi:hypothetical protein